MLYHICFLNKIFIKKKKKKKKKYFHGDLKSINYFFYRKELLEIFQKVTLGHIPNHCLKNTIYSRLLPKIKHEFPRQSLRYKLISTLNETSNELLEMAKTLSQKNFMNFVRNEILTGYRCTCELLICHVCKRT